MIFKNAAVFLENRFVTCDVAVEDGRIAAIGHHLGDGMDCTGLKLLPGLVDIHTHGCAGYDFDHATEVQLAEMSACYLCHGVTAVLATLMTNPRALLLEAAARCGNAKAPIRGIYLEGPFFGPAKKGAHDAQHLSPIDGDFFSALDEAANGTIRIVAVEPEKSPVLSKGKAGSHGIQGIGAGFVPVLLDRNVIDAIVTVRDEDAFAMAKKLSEFGVPVGISAGAAVWAASRIARENPETCVVTLLPDSADRYGSLGL